MATLLDLSVLQYLTPLFTFLFILVVSYAMLDKFKLLGEHFAPKAIASFSISMIFMFSTRLVGVVNLATPWFILMIVFGLFVVGMLMFMGVKEEAVSKAVKSGNIVWPVMVISLLILVISITNVFQEVQSPYGDEDDKTRTSEGLKALVHPRLLGALFLLLMTVYAIMFISQGFVKPS